MSDQTDSEIIAQKLAQGTMTIYQLLDHWYMKYGVPEEEVLIAKDHIQKLEKDKTNLNSCVEKLEQQVVGLIYKNRG